MSVADAVADKTTFGFTRFLLGDIFVLVFFFRLSSIVDNDWVVSSTILLDRKNINTKYRRIKLIKINDAENRTINGGSNNNENVFNIQTVANANIIATIK